MAKKAPRRTAERILESTLVLFNRFGEPNVSTTLISAELNISPGNLYYHYPAKDELVNALFTRYQASVLELLVTAPQVEDLEDAWFFLHSLFERVWPFRFIYRDLNDLLSRNRKLEASMTEILQHKETAFRMLLERLSAQAILKMGTDQLLYCSTHLVIQLTWWLSYTYVRDPRHAMEDEQAEQAMRHGAQHLLALLLPYANVNHHDHIRNLIGAYQV